MSPGRRHLTLRMQLFIVAIMTTRNGMNAGRPMDHRILEMAFESVAVRLREMAQTRSRSSFAVEQH